MTVGILLGRSNQSDSDFPAQHSFQRAGLCTVLETSKFWHQTLRDVHKAVQPAVARQVHLTACVHLSTVGEVHC